LLVADDGEWVVRYSAVVGLQALYTAIETQPELSNQILEKLRQIWQTDTEVAVSTRVQLALQKLNRDLVGLVY
jgi:phycocyanobilin lyase beta subunit